MNHYTNKLLQIELPKGSLKDFEATLQVPRYSLCSYHLDTDLGAENDIWESFWYLFAAFLATIDDETMEVMIVDIKRNKSEEL